MNGLRKLKVRPSRAVLGGLAILESFDEAGPVRSLAEISRGLDIPKATALRLLRALAEGRYVTRDDDTGHYTLGPGVLTLAEQFLRQHDTVRILRPLLAELASDTGETAHFGILQGREVVYLEIAESPQRVRAYVLRGDRLPAHCTAAGKAILADAAQGVVESFLAGGLQRLTPSTITDRAGFMRELRVTRRRGYGLNIGEWMEDVTGVSAAVFGHARTVQGAIGVAGPTSRLNTKNAHRVGVAVRDFAERASQRLGGARAA